MTTFESQTSSKTLAVSTYKGGPNLIISGPSGIHEAISVSGADAPALALAILEAAQGAGIDTALFDATHQIHNYVKQRETEAKEAADLEALVSEARALFLARHCRPGALEWEDCAQGEWLAVARAARELHGVAK